MKMEFDKYLENKIKSKFFDFDKNYKIALDIGSNKGLFTNHFSKYFEKIISIEADPYFAKFYNNNEKIIFVNKALVPKFIKEKQIKFYSTKKDNGSIDFRPNAEIIKVDTIHINDILNITKSKSIDLLKLDIEGNEYILLKEFFDLKIYPKWIFIEFHKSNDFFKGFELLKNYYYKITYIKNYNYNPFKDKNFYPIEIICYRSKLLDLGG